MSKTFNIYIVILLILLPFVSFSLNAQELSNSVYFGAANGTNIGGSIGLGTEFFINEYFSGSIALGSIHFTLKEDVDKSKFDFDIGLKFYPYKYFFIGINYGFIDYEYSAYGYADGSEDVSFSETRAFSFIIGARSPNFKNMYLSSFIGITSDNDANHSLKISGDELITPRLGILIGYCF